MKSSQEKMVKAARELLKTLGFFVDNLWHVEDVYFICEQNNLPKLSHQDAMEVFQIAKDQFDGEAGLSWPQLEKALNTYLLRKALLNGLCQSENA